MEESAPGPVTQSGTTPDEQKLIEQSQNGDGRAFGQLIRLHQKRLFRFALGLTGSFDQGEDIVQETFVKAYGAIGTFQLGYAFYPWLSTIARNLAYNQIAREERKESLEQKAEKGFDPASAELGPLEKLLNDEAQSRFFKAVTALPAKYRSVFVLRHFEDMDYNEISMYLKIPPGTVDSRLYRARQMLVEQLKDLL
jgi:RNA polymerase sigma-70 factor (ECF subfamily)